MWRGYVQGRLSGAVELLVEGDMHAPGDSKRRVFILDSEDFEGWLTCSVAEAKSKYCKQWHGQLVGEPALLPSRGRIAKEPIRAQPKQPLTGTGSIGELF